MIVVDPHYDIIRINTAARRVLGIHGTAFDQDFVHLADALPSTRSVTPSSRRSRARPARRSTRWNRPTCPRTRRAIVQATVRPYRRGQRGGRGRGHRADRRRRAASAIAPAHAGRGNGSKRRRAVNERLLRANDELTALIADLRRSNAAMLRSSEDAQAGREEVETLNEEFQATNEELETLNEELTATVEELRIANEDLAARTEELRLKAVAHRGTEARDRGGAASPGLDPGEHRRRGRRGRPRAADGRDERRL